jgi:hypothetical protein
MYGRDAPGSQGHLPFCSEGHLSDKRESGKCIVAAQQSGLANYQQRLPVEEPLPIARVRSND